MEKRSKNWFVLCTGGFNVHLSEQELVDGGATLVGLGDLLGGLLGGSGLSGGSLLASASVSDDLVAASDVSGLLLDGAALLGGGVGVQVEESLVVGEGVLAVGGLDDGLLGAKVGLNLGGVDDATEIGVGDGGAGQDEAGLLLVGEHVVEGSESLLGPDDEATDVTSGGELEEVEAVNVGDLYAGDVAEGGAYVRLSVGDEQRSAALHEAAVAALTLSCAQAARVLDALNVNVGLHGLQERHGLLSLRHTGEIGSGEHEGHLGHLGDAVAARHHERGHGGGGERGNNGESALALVHASVPAAPDLSGRKHTSSTAHVSESSLTAAVGTSSSDTGDTRDGTTGSPRLCRGLRSRVTRDGVRLTVVLRQVAVHGVHDIHTDGRLEHGGQLN